MPPVRGDRVGSRVPRSCCLPPSALHQCGGGLSPLALADPGAGRAPCQLAISARGRGEHPAQAARLLGARRQRDGRWLGFQGFVRVNNLLDNRYETFGTFAPNARMPWTPVERVLSPAPPVNVLAGLQYRYYPSPEVQLRCALTKAWRQR